MAARIHRPEDYFATIRTASGGSAWEHVRTNMGRRVAFGMIARHWGDEGRIESFRDARAATADDRRHAEGSDGVLRVNVWAGLDTIGESRGCY